MGELGFCHYSDILTALTAQLSGDIAADSGWPLFLIRLLHNKLFSGVLLSLQCYFQYLDTAQVFFFVSPFLLPFLIYAFWGKLWRKRIIFMTFLFPVVFIVFLRSLQIGTKIYVFQGFYILLAVIGWVKAIRIKFS